MQKVLFKIFFFIFIFCSFLSFAQVNLVPNPSFEVVDTCPMYLDQMSRCHSWSSFSQTPDYFNTCSPTSGIAPPYAAIGYQKPVYGNAYAGFVTYVYTSPIYREIIGAQLISSLQIGTKYYFSFFVSFGGIYDYTMATDKIGLRFSTVPYSKSNPAPINNFANYSNTNIITDSANWTQLKGFFIADSAYQFISLGNFFDDSHTDTIGVGQLNQTSYYYIDNVCLSTDSNYAYSNYVQEINNRAEVSVYPNPTINILTIFSDRDFIKSVEIIDPLGKLKIKSINTFNLKEIILDTSILDCGFYFCKVVFMDRIIVKQIIVSK